MVRIVAENFFRPEDVEKAMPYLNALVAGSRTEEGCLSYELYVDITDPSHIIIMEEWASQDVLPAHREQAHYKDNVKEIAKLVAKPGNVVRMEPLEQK